MADCRYASVIDVHHHEARQREEESHEWLEFSMDPRFESKINRRVNIEEMVERDEQSAAVAIKVEHVKTDIFGRAAFQNGSPEGQ
jgi:hypothetical protein